MNNKKADKFVAQFIASMATMPHFAALPEDQQRHMALAMWWATDNHVIGRSMNDSEIREQVKACGLPPPEKWPAIAGSTITSQMIVVNFGWTTDHTFLFANFTGYPDAKDNGLTAFSFYRRHLITQLLACPSAVAYLFKAVLYSLGMDGELAFKMLGKQIDGSLN